MLPKNWRRVPLHEVAEVRTGLAKGKTGQRDPVEVPYLRVANVQDGHLDLTEIKTITVEREQIGRYSLRNGDILMTEGGDFDKLGRGDVWQGQIEPCLHQNHVFVVRPNVELLDSTYLAALSASHHGRTYFLGCAKRSTNLASVNTSQVRNFPVLLPPLSEQQGIARVLKKWDEAITTNERLLANGREQMRAIQARLLALSIPHSATKKNEGTFPPSVQSGIPALPVTPIGWRRTALGKHLREVRRPIALEQDRTYALVTVKRSRGGVQRRECLRGAEIKTPAQFLVKAGDFLISKRQIVHGACGIVPPEMDGAVVSNEYAVLNSDEEIDMRFLRYLSESTYFQQTCFHSSIGVHVEKMIFRTERWLAWPFNIPPLTEQQRIVKILDTAALEILCIERQLKALTSEKAALMSQLLTGKRRVNVDATPAVAST